MLLFGWNFVILPINMDKHTSQYNSMACNASSGFVFICALIIYWLTADSSVSYWDCPEYVVTASRLEIGHPPGNPVWALAMRVATIPFPASSHAYVINLCSGLFMALSAFFLARIIYILSGYVLAETERRNFFISEKMSHTVRAIASTAGALSYALCDSTWFSAIEAEVYAMSAFLSSMTIWLMLIQVNTSNAAKRKRLLILISYITGLSLGVHQLNLLCIPVMALIYVYANRQHRRHALHIWLTLFLSFIAVASILTGMMHGSLSLCAEFELFAVNTLHLPYFSGVTTYWLLTTASFITAIYCIGRQPRFIVAVATFMSIWFSGLTIIGGDMIAGSIAAAVISFALVYLPVVSNGRLLTGIWMLGFILLGYASFMLIMIRGYAAPPMNEGTPSNIFALDSYISRDQYGSKPLLYGATPYSRPMLKETWRPGAVTPEYSMYALKKQKPLYSETRQGARLHHRSGFLTASDSSVNTRIINSGNDGYILSDYSFKRITTPELDMWVPRITESSPSMIESYGSWIGMDKTSMTHIGISTAIDSLGNPVGKMDASGKRNKEESWRPTYLQNLRMLMSYQIGYMYLRYLMWNFAGRQNDIPSNGEIDHGNFITGISFADEAMLGKTELMPASAGSLNAGRNVYYCIPFIFGMIGIIFLALSGKSGRRTLSIIALQFLMTGIAIVVYLNQSPGEPRERDYSFLVSFMAFSTWIAFGIIAVAMAVFRKISSKTYGIISLLLPSAGIPLLLLTENFDDHDRSGRFETSTFASNILGMPDGIIFTHGDNFTFPLWYAQETEGIGKGHNVVDISYLATPGYVVNLMRQGENSIRFTATPADIAYGAYAFTRIAHDADTVPVPLIKALRQLYSGKDGAPAFQHSRVTIPGKSMNDTLTINLRKITTGGFIPFRQLMLLDILATNIESDNPRPIYFLSHLSTDFYRLVKGATHVTPFAEEYYPMADSLNYLSSLNRQLSVIQDNALKNPVLPAYIDPVVADQHRRQRGALVRLGRVFLEQGMAAEASQCVETAISAHPLDIIPGASFTVADTTFHEGIELSRLMIDLSEATGIDSYRKKGMRYLINMHKTAHDWKRYYSALDSDKRSVVSNETRRLILTIPVIDSLLNRSKQPGRHTTYKNE